MVFSCVRQNRSIERLLNSGVFALGVAFSIPSGFDCQLALEGFGLPDGVGVRSQILPK